MFDALSDRFDAVLTRLKGRGKLSEADIDEALREIRVALLEADVNFTVVKSMVERIRTEMVGQAVSESLTPGQQVVKIVHQTLVDALGGETLKIQHASVPPTVVLMAGLQGTGKTTATGKLARWFKAQGRQPLLVGADLQRPAAVEQLRVLADQVGVPVHSEPTDPVAVARGGVERARDLGRDVVIIDTAGRLQIDTEMMAQVGEISEATSPDYTFLVIDAMTGQEAVNVAEAFHQTLAIDGVIMSKLDGDARGGAALSVKQVIGRPIAFASTGEKLDDFDQFHPDRMASRILGMGDVLTLIEKAEQAFDADEARKAEEALLGGRFTLEDFLDQMQQVKKMGPIGNLVGMMPGLPKELRNVEIPDKEVARIEAMIRSMTLTERRQPEIIDGSRRKRIASGSGTTVGEVNLLLKQFGEMAKMMKRMGSLAGGLPGGGGSKRKNKKGKKNKKGSGGGRVTPKGGPQTGRGPRPDLPSLPGLPGLDDR